jgi:hypothetical protein
MLAASKRNLLHVAELAHWLGFHSASVFNDYDNLFDSIDVPKLLQKAIHSNFHMPSMSFAL